MNYTINYPSAASGGTSVGHPQIHNTVPVMMNSQGQKTIVLTPPSAPTASPPAPTVSVSAGQTSGNSQQSFPMVIQMTSSYGQLFYTYQYPEGLVKSNENSTNNTIASQVVYSPVSPVQANGLNILKNTTENKPVSRSLGEVFNVQTLPPIHNPPHVVQSNNLPVQNVPVPNVAVQNVPVQNVAVNTCSNAQGSQSSCDLASLLSSLQGKIVGDIGLDNVYKIADGNVALLTVGSGDSIRQPSSGMKYIPENESNRIVESQWMVNKNGNTDKDLVFDKTSGNFIVRVRMSPEQYGRLVHENVIADIDSLVFDKDSSQFIVPVYMSPKEYGQFVQDKTLPYSMTQKRKQPAQRGRPRNDRKQLDASSVDGLDPDYVPPPVKRGRGRPRKYFPAPDTSSFTLATETKSGHVVKTPGKFSTCVSGKRKNYTSKRQNILPTTFDSSVVSTSSEADMTTTSMMVNTSSMSETNEELESTFTHYEDTVNAEETFATIEDSIPETAFAENELNIKDDELDDDASDNSSALDLSTRNEIGHKKFFTPKNFVASPILMPPPKAIPKFQQQGTTQKKKSVDFTEKCVEQECIDGINSNAVDDNIDNNKQNVRCSVPVLDVRCYTTNKTNEVNEHTKKMVRSQISSKIYNKADKRIIMQVSPQKVEQNKLVDEVVSAPVLKISKKHFREKNMTLDEIDVHSLENPIRCSTPTPSISGSTIIAGHFDVFMIDDIEVTLQPKDELKTKNEHPEVTQEEEIDEDDEFFQKFVTKSTRNPPRQIKTFTGKVESPQNSYCKDWMEKNTGVSTNNSDPPPSLYGPSVCLSDSLLNITSVS